MPKTFRPSRRPELTYRNGILGDLAEIGDDVPLLVMVAPPGYGKTTVLNQWAERDPRPFAWVRLEDSDNDPVRLLRHIALGMHRIRPVDYTVWRRLSAPDAAPFETALPHLLTTIAAGPPCVLVLDDLHVLRGTLGSDMVVALAAGLPDGFHLVGAGRDQAGLRVSGLRRHGRCVEFGPEELAFTPDETEQVLRSAGIRLSRTAVEDLHAWTEGWPAGVSLAALSLPENPDPDTPPRELPGVTRFVFDYLCDEVLPGESPETLRFLTRTSLLDRISAPLCDAVLDRTGSAALLADLERRNLFIVRPDAGRLWYRYRPLFREMLRAELERREPAEALVVHRRAAGWYEEHGFADDAVHHALASHDLTRAARLVVKYGQGHLGSGRLSVVREWLTGLCDGALEQYPALATLAGWIWGLSGDAARAQECLHAAERGTREPLEPARADPSCVSRIAILRTALAPYGVRRMLDDARIGFDLEPPGSPRYPVAAMLLGTAQLLNGDPEAARGTLERAAHLGRERQRCAASLALAQLSLLAAADEDWTVAQAYAGEAYDLVLAGQLAQYPSTVAVHVARARLALHRRDLAGARTSAAEAVALYQDPSPTAYPWFAGQMALALAGVALELDDYPAALCRMAEARRHIARLPVAGTLVHDSAKLAADLARTGQRLRYPVTLTAAEMRVLQLLPTHLTLSEIADKLYISRNTVKTQVASIYGKLHSSTRGEAVRAARERDLV